jgi:hypothetical protein
MSNKLSYVVVGIIGVAVACAIPYLIKADEARARVEAPYNEAIKAEQKKAFDRDCPKYFEANIIRKYTTMSKFSWCDNMKKE